jgi:hypothetical protein
MCYFSVGKVIPPRQATLTLAVLAIVVSGTSYASSSPSATTQQSSTNNHTLFQAGTYNSLNADNYDGEFTLKELRGNSDFGLGASDALDGEIIY